MNWGNPSVLYFLLLIPILIVLLFIQKNTKKRQLRKFSDEKLLDFHSRNFSFFYYNFKSFLLIVSLFFLVIGLARPQWDAEVREISIYGQDIVFLIDVSKSMDAGDIRPSRLERAKTHINIFLDELRGDRVGIVAFAGDAVTICPLTTDYSALKLLISGLDTDTITDFGTNIGRGLEVAASLFNEEATSRTIIMLTDGEDHEGRGLQMATQLAQEGVVIYAIGIGTPGGYPVRFRNQRGQMEMLRDNQGNPVLTHMDAMGLYRIADVTGGLFYEVTPQFSEIDAILRQISDNEKTKYATRQYFRYKEQYHYFLIIALLLLCFEGFINYQQRRRTNEV